jgi:hypothetical protein
MLAGDWLADGLRGVGFAESLNFSVLSAGPAMSKPSGLARTLAAVVLPV